MKSGSSLWYKGKMAGMMRMGGEGFTRFYCVRLCVKAKMEVGWGDAGLPQ